MSPQQRAKAITKLVGSTCALLALAASILAQVEPLQAVTRGVAAYFAGTLTTSLWFLIFNPATPSLRASSRSENPKAEAGDSKKAA
ncbi:MAG: hypothetical protein AMXMBFR81_14760 [Chthonomonas sp.]